MVNSIQSSGIIVQAKQVPGKQIQKGYNGVCSFGSNQQITKPLKNAANSSLKGLGFLGGNIVLGCWGVLKEVVARPIFKVGETISRVCRSKMFAEEFKNSQNNITTEIRQAYKNAGLPKSGEFITQDVAPFFKKGINTVKSIFTT